MGEPARSSSPERSQMHPNPPSPEHPPAVPLPDTPDPISPSTQDPLSLQAPQVLPLPTPPDPSSPPDTPLLHLRHLTLHRFLKMPTPLPPRQFSTSLGSPSHPSPPDTPDTSNPPIFPKASRPFNPKSCIPHPIIPFLLFRMAFNSLPLT